MRLQKQKMWLQQSLADETARLAALDKSIGIASNDHVAPNVAGMIRVHSGEYGKRGNFKLFIVGALQDFAPAPLSTPALLEMVVEHFGLNFITKSERDPRNSA